MIASTARLIASLPSKRARSRSEWDGEDVRLTFDQDGKAVEPTAASAENSALGDNPTVRQIYEHYTPMVKNLVLADTVGDVTEPALGEVVQIAPQLGDPPAGFGIEKPGRSRPELNYRALAKLFPEVVSGEYRCLHLEAGERSSRGASSAVTVAL